MDSAVMLVLFALLTAFVSDAAASCKQMANDEMLEYLCEGGHPDDLHALPLRTEKLRINGMPLRRVTADTFSRFNGNLLVLSCLHCEITDIDEDAFRNLVNLQQLNLDSNYLTTAKASWFQDLNYLTYLDLSYNQISDIEDDVYKNLPSLVDLRISGNRLRCLNLDEMSQLSELKRMFLSENSDFACPHAVSKFLEDRGVVFEPDPEWSKLPDDTIHVYVPPSYEEEDRRTTTTPAYRDRLPPNRWPTSEETRVPLIRNGMLFPEHHPEHYRTRNRRPSTTTTTTTTTTMRPTTFRHQEKMPLPRVEPRFPSAEPRTPHVPTELSSPKEMHHPHSTLESPRAPPPVEIHYPYSTLESPRVPPPVEMESSLEDIRMAEAEESSETERTLPPYISVHQTITRPYSTYATYPTEDAQSTGSEALSENEMIPTDHYDRFSRVGSTAMYPHQAGVTTSYDNENPYESSPMTPYDPDTDTRRTSIDRSTNVLSERPDNPSWMQDKKRYEQSHLTTNDDYVLASSSTSRPHFKTTAYETVYNQHESLDKESSADDLLIATEQAKADLSRMTSNNVFIRPSPGPFPEVMRSPSTDQLYQAFYEGKATMHPPLQSHQEHNDGAKLDIAQKIESETDKPLPGCAKENSALRIQSDIILMMSIIIAVFRHVIVEGF